MGRMGLQEPEGRDIEVGEEGRGHVPQEWNYLMTWQEAQGTIMAVLLS
jgi:hypothetical protein